MNAPSPMLSCQKRTVIRKQRCGGVTLVEALVVIAIIALLATLAGPSFSTLLANQRVQAVSSDIFMGLLKTRSEAIRLNANATLTPKAGGWAAGWQILTGITVLDDHSAPSGVTFSTAPSGGVTYQSSGRIQGSAAVSFQVTSTAVSTAVRCVTVDPSGRPIAKASSC